MGAKGCIEPPSVFWTRYGSARHPSRSIELQTEADGKSFNHHLTVGSSLPLVRSGHAIELSTMFDQDEETAVMGRAFDETFSETMCRVWVRFATCGDPSPTAVRPIDDRTKVLPA